MQLPLAPVGGTPGSSQDVELIRRLRLEYPALHVARDVSANHVSLWCPKSQVAAAAGRAGQASTTATLDVPPNRCSVANLLLLLRLEKRYPGVWVSVPPANALWSRLVTIKGPPAQVNFWRRRRGSGAAWLPACLGAPPP